MATSRISALRFIETTGVFGPADFQAQGISRAELYRLVREGAVTRTARGLYAAARHQPTAGHSLAQVAKRVPAGVICLLTALRFHELTTQSPAEVWIALSIKARKPHLDYPRLRVARFSGAALTEGIETHRVEGVDVQVYSAARPSRIVSNIETKLELMLPWRLFVISPVAIVAARLNSLDLRGSVG